MDDTTDRRVRYLTAGLALTAVVAAVAVGWLVWIAADPEYWFPDAFAQEGPLGDQGARGERGPRGPVGPPGEAGPGVDDVSSLADEALTGVQDLQSQTDDLSSRIDNLEGVDVYDLDSRLSDLDSRLSDLDSRLSGVESDVSETCDAFNFDLDILVC
jgi:hypothetical protein